MTIRVIGVGLGQTGTHSLSAALELLGFGECFHADKMLEQGDVRAAKAWLDIAAGRPARWNDIFREYRSIASFPAWALYKEMLARFPEARVVLTVRDKEQWFNDINAGDYAAFKADPRWLFWFSPVKRVMRKLENLLILDRKYHHKLHDRQYALEVFEEHIQEVRRAVPADRLLIFDVKQGWGPLCNFLNVPVPGDKPFPRLNDIESVRARLRSRFFFFRGVEIAVLTLLLVIVSYFTLVE